MKRLALKVLMVGLLCGLGLQVESLAQTGMATVMLNAPEHGIQFNIELRAGPDAVDIYLGYMTPGGSIVSLVLEGNRILETTGVHPIVTNFTPIEVAIAPLFQRTFSATDEPGTYLLFAALVAAGGDPLNPANITSLSTVMTTHAASPPAPNAGDAGMPQPPPPPTVSFAADVQPIFTANCALAGCHSGPRAILNLNLAAGLAFSNSVGVRSVEVNTLNRIQPGDPDNSYLLQKIRGIAAVGERMPFSRPPLADEAIAAIMAWVAAGAPNN